jgi:sodium-coupled monocarboxylate transporter 8/12
MNSILLAQVNDLGITDYVVLIVYLVASILIGSFASRRQKSLEDYCLANRKIPWWAACVSIVATDLSGVSYLGVPAWIYHHDLKFNFGVILMPLVMLAVVLIFVPVFCRAGVYTIYKYLENRFHPQARSVTAVLFLIKGFIHLGGAVYIPALALTLVTGIPLWVCIVIIGVATTLYTMKGGMHAVIWTDLMQFIVLTGGLILMIGVALSGLNWDLAGIWNTASHLTASATGTPHTTLMDWRLDLKTEATVWSLIAFYFVFDLGTYGADQVAVQRYLTMGSSREVFKSVIGSGFVTVFSVALMAGLGLILVVYYHQNAALSQSLSGMQRGSDMILPHFVMSVLPTGTRGAIFAAIFAATMSCVSAGLNSFSTVCTVDLYGRHIKADGSDKHYLLVAKVMTLASGVLTTLLALWVSLAKTTILQTINSLMSILIGPITAMFFLGVLTRRANFVGLLIGVAAGLAFGATLEWTSLSQHINWMWSAPLGCLITFTVGYLASLIAPVTPLPKTQTQVEATAVA